MPTVFVSHSSRDREFVERELLPLLRRHSVTAWYSRDDIPSAAVWERTIRDGLSTCEWFLVVLSPDAIRSEWVQTEVQWAMQNRRDFIVPVLVRECDPSELHLQLIRYQYVDFRQDSDQPHARLLAVWGIQVDPPHEVALRVLVKSRAADGNKATESETRIDVRDNATIGRAVDCTIQINDPAASRTQAFLRVRQTDGINSLWLFNVGTHPTLLNGTKVVERMIVAGDVITIGNTDVVVLDVGHANLIRANQQNEGGDV